MSDPTAQEPTMEEILASIRRIISEDDQPAAAEPAPPKPAAAAPPPPPPAPTLVHSAPEPVEEEEEDEVLELNEPAPAPAATHGDIDVFDPPKAAAPTPPPPAPRPAPAPAPVFSSMVDETEEGLLSGHSAATAASHFGALAQTISMPGAGRTLEDVVRELLRPLLKDWLDQHLPPMVEQAVRDEVERISRRRGI